MKDVNFRGPLARRRINRKTIIQLMAIRNYKFRIYPSQKQIRRLNEHFAISCEMYNACLEEAIFRYKNNGLTFRRTQFSRMVTEYRAKDEKFKIPYSETLRKTTDQLCWAFEKFFSRMEKKKAGANISVGFPRFKKRLKSIRFPDSGFTMPDAKHIELRRIGKMPIVLSRLPKGEVRELIIMRKPGGKWFVIFTLKMELSNVVCERDPVGIDVGIKSFATLSDRTHIDNPTYFKKSEKRIKRLQREVSRKVKGSNNRRKAKRRLAIANEKVKNQRTDFLHKISTGIVSKYGLIVVESLTVSSMVRDHRLAKSISDASWSRFIEMLQYKAESAGTEVLTAPKYEPTTKRCSSCGNIREVALSERVYSCPICGLEMDRDENAAINILNSRARGARIHACGEETNTSFVREMRVTSSKQELYA